MAEFERGLSTHQSREEWLQVLVRAWPTSADAKAQLDRLDGVPIEIWLYGDAGKSSLLRQKAMAIVNGATALNPSDEAIDKLAENRRLYGQADDRPLVAWRLRCEISDKLQAPLRTRIA